MTFFKSFKIYIISIICVTLIAAFVTGIFSKENADTRNSSKDIDFCPSDEACRILPLGDSITFGIGYNGGYRVELFRLALKNGKNITFVGQNPESDAGNQPNGPEEVEGVKFPKFHLGTSGITIKQLQQKVMPDRVLKAAPEGKAPHIVLLHIGTNDMWAGPKDADIRLGKMIDALTELLPNSLIVVSNIIPWPASAAKLKKYNSAIPAIVQERKAKGKHVIFADQFKNFPAGELCDGVHPNEKGYNSMAKVWYNAISQYLKDSL